MALKGQLDLDTVNRLWRLRFMSAENLKFGNMVEVCTYHHRQVNQMQRRNYKCYIKY